MIAYILNPDLAKRFLGSKIVGVAKLYGETINKFSNRRYLRLFKHPLIRGLFKHYRDSGRFGETLHSDESLSKYPNLYESLLTQALTRS